MLIVYPPQLALTHRAQPLKKWTIPYYMNFIWISIINRMYNHSHDIHFSPTPALSEMDTDTHIHTSANESSYEPIDHDTPTKELETDDNDMLDNMAYGRMDKGPVGTGQQSQYNTIIELKGNESYSPVMSKQPLSETGDDDMMDNMAYGQVDTVVELKGNESYNSVPSTPLPDEREYSYTMTKPAPLSSQEMTCDSIYW